MATLVRLLGEVEVLAGQQRHLPPIDKRLGLLGYLACRGRWVEREKLAFLFWPDVGNEQARGNLRGLLARTRKLPFTQGLSAEAGRVRWDVECDVRKFRHAIETEAWGEAVSLYRGGLLHGANLDDAGEFSSWVEMERESLKEEYRTAVFQLSQDLHRSGRALEATKVLSALLDDDPLDEEGVQRQMRLLADCGQPSRALEVYRAFHRRLGEELDLEPTSTTQRLANAIEAERDRVAELGREFEGHSRPATAEPDSSASPSPIVRAASVRQARGRTLPTPHTSFVGRDLELGELTHMLAEPERRLVTLTGTAGVGKTRLALQAARELAGNYRDGSCFVPLEAVDEVEVVPRHIAQAAGIGLQGQGDALTQLVQALEAKELLLVLDNYEQLTAAAAVPLALLENCPGLQLLVTSRERLGLAEEWLLPLSGLSYPSEDVTLVQAQAFDAVRFFVVRARQFRLGFELREDELPDLLRLCRLVDGLPLALELAAVWMRLMPLAEIADEVEARLSFLSGGARNAPDRHGSIRAAFDHSWKLLSEGERSALRKLSVFRAGFRREAAAYVAGASTALLAALVDKSLLSVSAAGRFSTHPLLAHYLVEKLAERPDEERDAKARHARYFLSLAEEADAEDETRQEVWFRRLDVERDNLRAAFDWFEGNAEIEQGLSLVAALNWFWPWRSSFIEGREWMSRALRLAGGVKTPAVLKIVHGAGAKAMGQGDFHAARPLLEESLEAARATGDDRTAAQALNALGLVAHFQGDYPAASERLDRALTLARRVDDKWVVMTVIHNMGYQAYVGGDLQRGRSLLEESLATARELGDKRHVASRLVHLGRLARELGERERSRSLNEEALTIAREVGNPQTSADALYHLGLLAQDEGELDLARQFQGECLKLRWESGTLWMLGASLDAVAALEASAGRTEQASWLWGAADAWRDVRSAAVLPIDLPPRESAVATARDLLGDDRFEAAKAAGAAAPLSQVVAVALEACRMASG